MECVNMEQVSLINEPVLDDFSSGGYNFDYTEMKYKFYEVLNQAKFTKMKEKFYWIVIKILQSNF